MEKYWIWILLAVVVIIALWVMNLYNSLTAKRNQVKNAFSNIDVRLKKRYDLIPNLVAAVKEYMTHERELLSSITELRSRAMQPGLSNQEQMKVENQLSTALRSLNVQIENYPNLKANENVMQLQSSLTQIEQDIAMSRDMYNGQVTTYNTSLQVFPNNMFAGMLGFLPEVLFETPAEQRENVDVSAMFKK